ncbi:17119_t:CDS:10 [Acaulospora morrowiae]|uniref:Autophagy-related protein 17 n=1 Tax=Acaulospora morrowiae TaxID=94023 RepID=A0A9N9AG91_9GLOM|nr:17119_t:CDS:10 [Acaulospora morrowiae]
MEQQLINIISISQKALQHGGKLCSKAEGLAKECRNDVESIEKLYPKLKFLWGELEGQVQVIDKFREFAVKQNGILQHFHASKEQELSTITEKLNATLDRLRAKYVDPVIRENAIAIEQMVRVNSSNMLGELSKGLEFDLKEKGKYIEEKASLYDYVEEQSIQELKIKTQEEVTAIQHYHNTSSKIIESVNVELKKLDDMLMSNNISLEESGVDFSYEKFDTLEQKTQRMAETLESLARHYDQVTSALKAFQTQSDAQSLLDITGRLSFAFMDQKQKCILILAIQLLSLVLEKDTDMIPSIAQELQEDVQFIESVSEEVRVRNHIYRASYEEAYKIFSELDGFGNHMENHANTMKELEADFEKGAVMVDRLLEELLNLNLWQAPLRYVQMEIDRRHKVKEQHRKFAEEYLAKLEGLYQEEIQQRDIFYQNHGRYLPINLCPPILEPPTRYGIVPQDETKLPVLSQRTLSEAQENLMKYRGEGRIF